VRARPAEGRPSLRGPAELARHVLLHPSPCREDWRRWLRAAGLPEAGAEHGQTFETMEMAVGAAAGGLGVTVADLHLFRDELSTGRLVAPFGLVLSDDTGLFLFAERGRFEEPKLAAFRDWLLAEVAADGTVGRGIHASSSPGLTAGSRVAEHRRPRAAAPGRPGQAGAGRSG
jgi:LysR family transcriptional regulator, glycine cleavage system transcriptional activator